jgi:hypothetical protein
MSPRNREKEAATVPPWPVIQLVLDSTGRATIDGQVLDVPENSDPKDLLIATAIRRAEGLGRPLRIRASDSVGAWHLVAYPDGEVVELADTPVEEDLPDRAGTAGRDSDHGGNGHSDSPDLAAVSDDSPDGLWHLRVHPSGEIVPVDELPVPDGKPVHRATSGGVPVSGGVPESPPALSAPPHTTAGDDATCGDTTCDDTTCDDTTRDDTTRDDTTRGMASAPPADEPADRLAAPVTAADEPATGPQPVEDPAEARQQEPAESTAAGQPRWPRKPAERKHLLGRKRPAEENTPDAAAEATPANLQKTWYEFDGLPSPLLLDPDSGVVEDDLVHSLRTTAEPSSPGLRRRWVPAAVATTLGALAVSGIVIILREESESRPLATGGVSSTFSGSVPDGAGASGHPSTDTNGRPLPGASTSPSNPPTVATPPATLNIGPPPGFSAAAVWALPVAGPGTAAVSADGLVASLTTDHQLAFVDPATGAVRWHSPAPTQASGPYLSHIDGKRVVAMATFSQLRYWVLPTKDASASSAPAPIDVALPTGSVVTWSGPSPLITLRDGAAAVIHGTDVQPVSLPTGARPLAADGADVLAVTGRDWIRQTAGQPPGTPQQLAIPEGATGQSPLRVENVGGAFLSAMWASPKGPIVVVYDARRGTKLIQATFPTDVDFTSAATIRETDGERMSIGTALIDPAQRNLSILDSSFTPIALTPGHIYANNSSGTVADLQIKGKDLKPVPFTGHNPTVPVGIVSAGSRSLALVVVPHGSGWLLCALPPA